MQIIQKTLTDGVTLLALPDDRFKTTRLVVSLLLPLRAETASEQAILPALLRRSCAAYPDFTALNKQLNRLYGAWISADVMRIGEVQALSLQASCLNDCFALNGEPVVAACAELMRGMLFEPALENGCFRDADVEQERRCLIEDLQAEINEKRRYARRRCEEMLCEGEAYAVNCCGTVESVQALTKETITAAWKRVLSTAQVQLIVQGGDYEAVAAAFTRGFSAIARQPVALSTVLRVPTGIIRSETEEMPVNQSKLVMGFRCAVDDPEAAAPAMRLMTALFGGTPYSLLFRHVREELHLCYYCAATYDRHKGVLLVDSGVERAKAPLAQDEVLRQLRRVAEGDFSDEDLESARRSICSQFASVDDSPSSRVTWYLGQSTAKHVQTPEQAANAVAAVTREQVMAAARGVSLELVYLLASNGQGGEDDA